MVAIMRIRQYPVQKKKKKNEMEGKERKGGRRKENKHYGILWNDSTKQKPRFIEKL